jgi:hypothetical protein
MVEQPAAATLREVQVRARVEYDPPTVGVNNVLLVTRHRRHDTGACGRRMRGGYAPMRASVLGLGRAVLVSNDDQVPLENADERTRTSTWLPRHGPEPCASTNSATSAGSRAKISHRSNLGPAPPCRRRTAGNLRLLASNALCEPPSSRGLGRRPLTAVTRVRIPLAVLILAALEPCGSTLRSVACMPSSKLGPLCWAGAHVQ